MRLDEVVEKLYVAKVTYIKRKNRVLEAKYFKKNQKTIPYGELLSGRSYEEIFQEFQSSMKYKTEFQIDQIFMLMQELFMFSKGHDLMFNKKLEADYYMAPPIDSFWYPKITEAVHKKYNDFSVMEENPHQEENLEGIEQIMNDYLDAHSLLYLLYSNDFQFPIGWETYYENYKTILSILKETKITIGEFLHALIDYKCEWIRETLEEIADSSLKEKYLKNLKDFRETKHLETQGYAHVNLPADYFLDQTLEDFIKYANQMHSIILPEEKPLIPKRVILP